MREPGVRAVFLRHFANAQAAVVFDVALWKPKQGGSICKAKAEQDKGG
jgi:hypothetical protein